MGCMRREGHDGRCAFWGRRWRLRGESDAGHLVQPLNLDLCFTVLAMLTRLIGWRAHPH